MTRGGLRNPKGGRPKSPDGPGHAILLKFPKRHLATLRVEAAKMGLPVSTACVRILLAALSGRRG